MITTYLNGFQVRAVVRTQAITKFSSPSFEQPSNMVLPFRKFQRIIDHVFRVLLLYYITSVTKRLTGLWITLKDFQYSMTSTWKQQQQSCSIFFDKYQKSPTGIFISCLQNFNLLSPIVLSFSQSFPFGKNMNLFKIRNWQNYCLTKNREILKSKKIS